MFNQNFLIFSICGSLYVIICLYCYFFQIFEKKEVIVVIIFLVSILKPISEEIFSPEYSIISFVLILPIILFDKDSSLLQKTVGVFYIFSLCSMQYLFFFKIFSFFQVICMQITLSLFTLGFTLACSKIISFEKKLLIFYVTFLLLSIQISFLCSFVLHSIN